MFMVFFNNRPAGKLKFPSYERGRQYARKLIRKKDVVFNGTNPNIGDYGYSVRPV